MDKNALAIVSFMRSEAEAALSRSLNGIGISSMALQASSLCENGVPDTATGIIFLFGARLCDTLSLHAAVEIARNRPSLALITADNTRDWDTALLDACWDFAKWPCCSKELAYRLARLTEPMTGGACRSTTERSHMDPEIAASLSRMNLIGRSPAFLKTMRQLCRVLKREVPVMIQGETGTGKELVARAVHYLSHRGDGPFVPVNCGALPDSLVENELFGHERGAYTDAKGSSPGAVGEAAGGTLFLDEIETLSPKAQAALLRFLSGNEFRPLGSSAPRTADTRVVAASNSDLKAMRHRGAFRSDLYFRLNVLPLTLPPLRERGEDIELLARHFVRHYCRWHGLAEKRLAAGDLRRLRAYRWPGNIRELENLIHRSVLMTDGPMLHPASSDIFDTSTDDDRDPMLELQGATFGIAKAKVIERFERDYLFQVLTTADGNITRAARMAGKERRALGKLLKKYGISAKSPLSSRG